MTAELSSPASVVPPHRVAPQRILLACITTRTEYPPMPFQRLGLPEKILSGVRAMGYVDPTPIQLRTIPLLLSDKDVVGSAQTGTGKTAAFALPILAKLDSHQPSPRALVLEPTRELAAQVETSFRDLARFTDITITVLYGGIGYGRQNDDLKRGVDIVVATPGRLLDHLQRGNLRLQAIRYLVLDEADRMLDMGFLPDVRRIIERCPRDRQTSLFGATIPPEIESLVKWAMRNPQTIEIGIRRAPAETVRHAIYPVSDFQKDDLLVEFLERLNYDSIIVFCRTKIRADRVAHLLRGRNHAVALLHSNRTQQEREQALNGFRSGRFEVLVATDIAARGLDITRVSHVINYDVPQHPEDYVHRIGRTGRAEATGDAVTLMVAEDIDHVAAIERFIAQKIARVKLDNFNYRYTALFEQERPGAQPAAVGKVRSVRLSGGYYFGRMRRRR